MCRCCSSMLVRRACEEGKQVYLQQRGEVFFFLQTATGHEHSDGTFASSNNNRLFGGKKERSEIAQ